MQNKTKQNACILNHFICSVFIFMKNEAAGACNACRGGERCIQGLGGEIRGERDHLE